MKSPEEIGERLARQWYDGRIREERLLGTGSWPLHIPIAKPAPGMIKNQLESLRSCLARWRRQTIGEVTWEAVRYRDLAGELNVPRSWILHKPSEWVAAAGDKAIQSEFSRLAAIIGDVDPIFRPLIIRRRHLIGSLAVNEVTLAARLALLLEPGVAKGAPLRALALAGNDSKFFERNRALMTALLDARFDGAATEYGLEGFLGAPRLSDQWLLLADLDGGLLPFDRIRVRDTELMARAAPGKRVLIVENEQCRHLIPSIPDTVAILGAGLNLAWMDAHWIRSRPTAYWGDIDTWGLSMLAKARLNKGDIQSLLMNRATFDAFAADRAVVEPAPAGSDPPRGLSKAENDLYRHLLTLERGRLEQEFLDKAHVERTLLAWAG